MKKIFEFKIVERKTEHEFYRCVEANTIQESEVLLKQKGIDFQQNYYELNVIITQEAFERLERLSQKHQTTLMQHFYSDREYLNDLIGMVSTRYAVTVDFEKEEIKVYPTFDPMFKKEK